MMQIRNNPLFDDLYISYLTLSGCGLLKQELYVIIRMRDQRLYDVTRLFRMNEHIPSGNPHSFVSVP